MKKCTMCNKSKEESDFWKDSTKINGRTYCKECGMKTKKKYEKNNKDKIRELEKERRLTNLELYRKRDQAYYHKKRNVILIKKRSYREQNRETCRERIREHYYNNKEKYMEANAKRKRELKFIRIMDNPFPSEIEIDWHHINDILVFPLPRELHKKCYDVNRYEHRKLCDEFINNFFDLSSLLCYHTHISPY